MDTLSKLSNLTARQIAAAITATGVPVSWRTVNGWRLGRPVGRWYVAALKQLARRAAR